jgi:hypothetical protein
LYNGYASTTLPKNSLGKVLRRELRERMETKH